MNKQQEYLLYGRRAGEPSYMEDLLNEGLFTKEDIDRAKANALARGYVTLRLVKFNLGMPDFVSTINLK